MRIMIVGAGDIGLPLVDYLSDKGHLITVIEKDERMCKKVANKADAAIFNSDADDLNTWKSVEADKMDALMALTNDDQANLSACKIAKASYGIPFIVARANQPDTLPLLKQAGADVVICPSIETRPLFLNAIENQSVSTLFEQVEASFRLVMVNIPQNGVVIGQTMEAIDNLEKVKVASVFRNGSWSFPDDSFILKANDKVLLLGSTFDVERAVDKLVKMEIT